ncbi:MAG: hypothetical protein V4501_12220 [Pseudomonadota bacterium]
MVRPTRKRKKTAAKKPGTRRRRRVNGANDIGPMIMTGLALGAGAIAAREVSNIVLKQWPGIDKKIIAAGQIAIGFVLPKFVKAPVAANIGKGMVAFGFQVMAVEVGVISGVGMGGNRMSYRVNGTANLRPINGTPNLIAVNGVGGTDKKQLHFPTAV